VAAVLLLFAALGLASVGAADGVRPLFTSVFVVIAGWFVNATVLNDLSDEAIDQVNLQNARGRPLISGDATRRELLTLGVMAGAGALVVAWSMNWRVGVVVSAGLALNVAYSLPPMRLSGRGVIAVVLLPLGYVALPFLVGAYAAGPTLGTHGLALLAGLYVTFIGRIVLKDFRDVTGDAQFNKRTFLLRHGRQQTCAVSAACWIIGSAALLLIVPVWSLLSAVFVAYVACAIHGLRLLVRADHAVTEQVIIGAIASVGRGMGITLLAHLTMLDKGWSSGRQDLVYLALAVLVVGMYRAIVRERARVPAEAIRPY
jgi:4-hydroxybenzoate polyprenyltransferase